MRKQPQTWLLIYTHIPSSKLQKKNGMTVKWGANSSLRTLRPQPKDEAMTHYGWFWWLPQMPASFSQVIFSSSSAHSQTALSASHAVGSDWRLILLNGKRGEVTCTTSGTGTYPPSVPTSPHNILSLPTLPAGSPHTGWLWKPCVEDGRDTR